MKCFKAIFAGMLLTFSIPAFAQFANTGNSSNRNTASTYENHSGMFVEPAIGLMVGDCDTDFGIGVGFGYRWHIANGFSWDVLKISGNTGVSHLSEMFDARFLTGIRYTTDAIIPGRSVYVNLAMGWNILPDQPEWTGFAYEIGAGLNLTNHVSLGLVWEGNCLKYEDPGYPSMHNGLLGVKLGYQF